jgi:hypothetical protein
MLLLGLIQLVMVIIGAALVMLPCYYADRDGHTAGMVVWRYVGDVLIAGGIILAFVLHKGIRKAVFDGERGKSNWFARGARWHGLAAGGCLVGGFGALLITEWSGDKQGVSMSIWFIIGSAVFFGSAGVVFALLSRSRLCSGASSSEDAKWHGFESRPGPGPE